MSSDTKNLSGFKFELGTIVNENGTLVIYENIPEPTWKISLDTHTGHDVWTLFGKIPHSWVGMKSYYNIMDALAEANKF